MFINIKNMNHAIKSKNEKEGGIIWFFPQGEVEFESSLSTCCKKNSLKNRKYMYCMILDNFSIQNDLIRYQLTWYMKCLISNNSVDNCESIVWIFHEKDHTCLWEMLCWRTLGSRFFMFIDLGSPYSIRFFFSLRNLIPFVSI